MKLQMVGCSHHSAKVEVREKLAFSRDQAAAALARFRSLYPGAEAVLLSTCNRVELYFASETAEACPTHHDAVAFLAEFHGLAPLQIFSIRARISSGTCSRWRPASTAWWAAKRKSCHK